jgi:hypothetical protein
VPLRTVAGWRPSAIGPKVLWRASQSAGNARPPMRGYLQSRIPGFSFVTTRYRNGGAQMWRMSTAQALIFIALVVVMVALTVWMVL